MSGLGQRSEEGATQDMNAFSCYSGLLLSYAFFHCCCDNSWAGGCLKPYRFFSLTVTEIGSLRRVSLGSNRGMGRATLSEGSRRILSASLSFLGDPVSLPLCLH